MITSSEVTVGCGSGVCEIELFMGVEEAVMLGDVLEVCGGDGAGGAVGIKTVFSARP